ncbi:MAG TPA: topoisomerase [Candidatus Bathyarchaeota archaeon]|nr:MAG: topoisomerase [Candidatus Bathyarchaeota archaeon]HDI07361.1 topoisomerase [Candidatus Bathyarchaeota archaeon]
MSSSLLEKEEKILKLLEELAVEAAKGTPILVEGSRDVEALRSLAVKGRIISVKTGGKSFLDAVSEVENAKVGEVVVLMDFDPKGVELTKKLVAWLEHVRVKPNLSFWRRLRGLVGREVKDVEGLVSYLRTLRGKLEIHKS